MSNKGDGSSSQNMVLPVLRRCTKTGDVQRCKKILTHGSGFLGDTAMNSLEFPWFRISYFLMLTSIYVIFQWVVHAFVSIWWPYPFLDLSRAQAPIWYLVVAVLHVPCYGIFYLVAKTKHFLLSKLFPHSYGRP